MCERCEVNRKNNSEVLLTAKMRDKVKREQGMLLMQFHKETTYSSDNDDSVYKKVTCG